MVIYDRNIDNGKEYSDIENAHLIRGSIALGITNVLDISHCRDSGTGLQYRVDRIYFKVLVLPKL